MKILDDIQQFATEMVSTTVILLVVRFDETKLLFFLNQSQTANR